MFWHGAPLSRVERLSLTSFLRNGHPVHLYVYEEPAGVPGGVRLLSAAEILPRNALFRHRRTQSFALFADWFRYRLLFERGGVWADADMICLQPLEYASDELFAWQDDKYINNALLGLPTGHPLAGWLADSCEHPNRFLPYDELRVRLRKAGRWLRGNLREHMRWGESGPEGLTRAARHLGYLGHALPSWHFYPVSFAACRALFTSPVQGAVDFGDSRAVHLWNQVLNMGEGFDKNARFPADSPFEQLCARYLRDGE